MIQSLPRRALIALALLIAAPFAPAQTLSHHAEPSPATANTPIGRWLSPHTSAGGIGSWWDFRADGTFSMYIGAAVTAHITHTADIVNVPAGTTNGATLPLDYKVTGNLLNLRRPGDPDTLFTREGLAPKPSDPLLGRWRPNPPATYSNDPQLAARQHAMTLGVYLFGSDNTQTVRIPFVSRSGTWDPAAHTFKLDGEQRSYTFNLTPQGLALGQPPDGTKTETYIPDPLFPQ